MSDQIAPPAPKPTGLMDRLEKLHDDMTAKTALPAAAPPTPDPKTTPTAPPPPPPDDDFEIDGKKVAMPDGIKSEQGKNDWRTWKGMAKTKITALEKDIAALKDAPKIVTKQWEEKIAAAEKEKAELAEQLGQLSLERTPEFQRHYIAKLEQHFKTAKEIVGADKADQVDAILRLPDGAHKDKLLDDLYEELPTSKQGYLSALRLNIAETMREKADAITDWKNQLEQKGKVDALRAAENKGKLDALFAGVVAEAKKDPELLAFQEKQGDDAWNKSVAEAINTAKGLFESNDYLVRAKLAIAATGHKVAHERLKAAEAENAELKKHIESLKAVKPEIRGGEGTVTTAPTVRPDGKAESLAERIARRSQEAGFVK